MSSICRAAIFDGKLTELGGSLIILGEILLKLTNPLTKYLCGTANGITSVCMESPDGGFSFIFERLPSVFPVIK